MQKLCTVSCLLQNCIPLKYTHLPLEEISILISKLFNDFIIDIVVWTHHISLSFLQLFTFNDFNNSI